MRILCYGDSNTWGYNPVDATRYNKRWTKELARLLPEDEIIEEGLNGRTFSSDDPEWPGRNGLDVLPVLLRTHRPLDLVIVMLGSNDLKKFFSMTEKKLVSALNITIDTIRNENLAIPYAVPSVLVVAPVLLGDSIITTSKWADVFNKNSLLLSRRTSELFRQVSNRRKTFFCDASEIAHPSDYDALHLDEENHLRLAEALAAEINTFRENI